MDAEREAAGLQLYPGSRLSREQIKEKLGLEQKCLLKEEVTQIAGFNEFFFINKKITYLFTQKVNVDYTCIWQNQVKKVKITKYFLFVEV